MEGLTLWDLMDLFYESATPYDSEDEPEEFQLLSEDVGQ